MPYEINFTKNGVYVTYIGTVSKDVILEADQRFAVNPRFKQTEYYISDFLQAVEINLSDYDMKIISHNAVAMNMWHKHTKLAIVVKENHLELAGLFKNIVINAGIAGDVELFTDLSKARQWATED